MASKEMYTALEELFAENEKSYVTYENVMDLFVKPPTPANVKKLMSLLEKYKVTLISSAEIAKMRNKEEARKREEERQKLQDEALEEEFDLASEKELLEWSRSDSPVRMYLREMGQISLLTKDEEIDISKKIEFGEDIIIDAFCSVPYLIDFILDYKEALINRERRVKELFKTFEDDTDDGDDDGEQDLLGLGDTAGGRHDDLTLFFSGQDLHDGRLDNRHQRHVAVRGNRDGTQQVRGQAGGDEDSGRAIGTADDADGTEFIQMHSFFEHRIYVCDNEPDGITNRGSYKFCYANPRGCAAGSFAGLGSAEIRFDLVHYFFN